MLKRVGPDMHRAKKHGNKSFGERYEPVSDSRALNYELIARLLLAHQHLLPRKALFTLLRVLS